MASSTSAPGTGRAGPLEGIVVLEVGAFMAAPFATMHLADLGARVLKVENPATGGDPVRATSPFLDGESSPFIRLNRNKDSVALDLKSAAGRIAQNTLISQERQSLLDRLAGDPQILSDLLLNNARARRQLPSERRSRGACASAPRDDARRRPDRPGRSPAR